ncbi:MAG: SDR family NAD(P)-dependent oxidoreductase [Acidimicrobiales bacterium]
MALPPPAPDRTCLVPGASSGIGVELARCLARRGHGVTLVARRQDRLDAAAAELAGLGIRAEVIVADLADADQRRAIAGRVAELGLTVDVLVNNAGVTTSGPVHRGDREREVAMVRIDVEAVVDLCSTFVPDMAGRGRGAVLNVASTAAFQPLPGQAGYGASKAFVLSYTEALAAELRGTGVTATVLCPGPVNTDFGAAGGIAEEDATEALPKVMWLPAGDVARAGVDGLARGRRVVIPGSVNRLSAFAAGVAPHSVILRILARQHPSMRP